MQRQLQVSRDAASATGIMSRMAVTAPLTEASRWFNGMRVHIQYTVLKHVICHYEAPSLTTLPPLGNSTRQCRITSVVQRTRQCRMMQYVYTDVLPNEFKLNSAAGVSNLKCIRWYIKHSLIISDYNCHFVLKRLATITSKLISSTVLVPQLSGSINHLYVMYDVIALASRKYFS